MATAMDSNQIHLTPLHEAAFLGKCPTIKSLLKKGHNANEREPTTGATPAMLACLSGSTKAVKVLMENNAEMDLKDQRGHDAGAYARGHIEKRLMDLFGAVRKDITSDRIRLRRKVLAGLLKSKTNFQLHAETDLAATDYYWLKHGSNLILLAPQAVLPIPACWKQKTTAAILGRGNIFPEMFAVSGYASSIGQHFLDDEKYTHLVMAFCKLIDFPLPGKQNDNGAKKALPEHQGRWFAGHCEKKLAVYWILKCLQFVLKSPTLRTDQSALEEALKKLKTANLPSSMRSAVILLDRNPCFGGQGKCAEFLVKVREHTCLDIWYEVKPSVGAMHLVKVGRDRRWALIDDGAVMGNVDDEGSDPDNHKTEDHGDQHPDPNDESLEPAPEPEPGEDAGSGCKMMILNLHERQRSSSSALEGENVAKPQGSIKHARKYSFDQGGASEVRLSKRLRVPDPLSAGVQTGLAAEDAQQHHFEWDESPATLRKEPEDSFTPPNQPAPPLRPGRGVSEDSPAVVRRVVDREIFGVPKIDKRSIETNLRYVSTNYPHPRNVSHFFGSSLRKNGTVPTRARSQESTVTPKPRSAILPPQSKEPPRVSLREKSIRVGSFNVHQYHVSNLTGSNSQNPTGAARSPVVDLTSSAATKRNKPRKRATRLAKRFDVSGFKNDQPPPRGVQAAIQRLHEDTNQQIHLSEAQ
ncbi:Serine/threonine-protein phosphatase 6 regulatory ankyrin repeat subunit C [Zalerion maritima]|uniref:Serine/threonine-protein phosphatase 6 regulatory ankyrin repeat subunit C n=1 Tax=Zalerion maritima TaxID=339359 RepID=A0AAD5RRP0_9PEZI|nr:Serine/threonine-protein phosphatase 6 regulatory ankyrin repeat subunit C [Zalerion maritima]